MKEKKNSLLKSMLWGKILAWIFGSISGGSFVLCLASREWHFAYLSALSLILIVYALYLMSGLNEHFKESYQPGKGFDFYRKTTKEKLHFQTICQLILFTTLIGAFIYGKHILSAIFFITCGILFSQFYVKQRIKKHNKPTEDMLNELRFMNILRPGDHVIGRKSHHTYAHDDWLSG